MKLTWRRHSLPPALAGRLEPDELVTAVAEAESGHILLTTRRGLWVVADGRADRLGWERVAKARLELGVLTLTPLVEVPLPAGTAIHPELAVVRDGSPWEHRLGRPAKVTDQVQTRVRRSVAASRYLPWPGAGGWVALRRVPGRDGLLAQVRLDPSADPLTPGFLAAVDQVATDLRGSPTMGTTGVD